MSMETLGVRWVPTLSVKHHEPERLTDQAVLATYPPPYPRGWYLLLHSEDVARNEARATVAFGRRFLVIRDHQGTIRVIDGHCPHLGAALPEGRLRDGCLRCPFHGWTLDATGAVREIPYQRRVPPRLRAHGFPANECDGQIFVWWGDRDSSEPDFELMSTPQIDSGEFVLRGRHDAGEVGMHLIEFAENGADLRHFEGVHHAFKLPWTDLRVPGVSTALESSWRVDEMRPWVSWLEILAAFSIGDRVFRSLAARADIEFIGPGSVARFWFSHPKIGTLLLYHCHTPVAPLRQRVGLRWFASPRFPRVAIWWLVGQWVAQWRDDVRIWEQKIYRRRPRLVPGDGPVMKMRRWFSQFYDRPQ